MQISVQNFGNEFYIDSDINTSLINFNTFHYRSVPRKVSSYMLLTGKPISAAEALNSGLISKMTKNSEDLEVEIESICQAIISKPRGVIALGKKFYYEQLEMGLTQAFEAGNVFSKTNIILILYVNQLFVNFLRW